MDGLQERTQQMGIKSRWSKLRQQILGPNWKFPRSCPALFSPTLGTVEERVGQETARFVSVNAFRDHPAFFLSNRGH
jgi:hypothetical protein